MKPRRDGGQRKLDRSKDQGIRPVERRFRKVWSSCREALEGGGEW
jgi:hypothetical protein